MALTPEQIRKIRLSVGLNSETGILKSTQTEGNQQKVLKFEDTELGKKINRTIPVVPPTQEQQKNSSFLKEADEVDYALKKQLADRGLTLNIKELEESASKAGLGRNLIISLKEMFIDPVGRAFLRPFTEIKQGIEGLLPGGKTGKEILETPFGKMEPISEKPLEPIKEAGELALTFLPLGKILKPVGKEISKFFGIVRKTEIQKTDDVVGKIIQGKVADKKKAILALKEMDLTKIKTYADLAQTSTDRIALLSQRMDEVLEQYPETKKLSEWVVKTKVGDKEVAQNFVAIALSNLSELYKKIADDVNLERIKQLAQRAKADGLNVKEINQLAREYGIDFGEKAFGKAGEPLTSVNAKKYENIRSGLKDTFRRTILDEIPKLLDEEMSSLFTVKRLAKSIDEKVNNLANKVVEKNFVQKVSRILGKGVDIATFGAPREFIRAVMLESNIGKKTSNALALQDMLQKNIKEFDKLLEKNSDDIIEYLADKIKQNPLLYQNIIRGTLLPNQ